jgi:hypothetical protein
MKDATFIAVLLDRSGSMKSVKDETISGFNHFLSEQKEAGANASLTLVQFDSVGIDTVSDNIPIRDAKPLDAQTYQPRAMTPLLDALGQTIINAGQTLSETPEAERPDKVVFVVITDGLENASREFTKGRIREMIQTQTEVYKWQFVYLGANQDAFAEAAQMGVTMDNAADYKVENMQHVYAAASENLRSFRATGRARALNFTKAQRAALAEDPKLKNKSQRTPA